MKKQIICFLLFFGIFAFAQVTYANDAGLLRMNPGVLSDTTEESLDRSHSVGYEISPNLFLEEMRERDQEVRKQQAEVVTKSRNQSFQHESPFRNRADTEGILEQLFQEDLDVRRQILETEQEVTASSRVFFVLLAVVVLIGTSLLGIFLGKKYNQWSKKRKGGLSN